MEGQRQTPRSYKLDDERDFNVAALQMRRMSERGFMRLWDEVPTNSPMATLPPSEHYERIIASFREKDVDGTLFALKEFADYLFKNGFDDPEEFERIGICITLTQLCEIPFTENPFLAPAAFHVLSVLQACGPQFPRYLQSNDFALWCFGFLRADSPVLYYSLTCLMNHSALGGPETIFVQELIPIETIRLQFDAHVDVSIRETLLDLGCRYSKVPLRPDMALALIDLSRIALLIGEPAYYPSAFWILVRLLRHYTESILYIMCDVILANANRVLKCGIAAALIPGMIFTSYVYELGFKYPKFSIGRLLRILSDPPDMFCQRQACRTLTKIVVRRADMIPMLVTNGIFYHIACALDIAKLRDKFEIALLACDVIDLGGMPAVTRVFQTRCVNLWVDFLDWENEDIIGRALQSLSRIFEVADSLNEKAVAKMQNRFLAIGGVKTIEKLMNDENEEISGLASEFFDSYLSECPPHEAEDLETDTD
jgi:hypothetical protein